MRVVPSDIFINDIEKMLSDGNNVELRCLGNSMHPYLRGDGSEKIIASPFSPDDLIPGAIVLFRFQGKHICHRIIMREEDHLLMQGDGTINKQEHVTVSDVIGIIRIIIRRNKKPVSTKNKAAKRYWRCWVRLMPVRRYLLFIYRLWLKISRK